MKLAFLYTWPMFVRAHKKDFLAVEPPTLLAGRYYCIAKESGYNYVFGPDLVRYEIRFNNNAIEVTGPLAATSDTSTCLVITDDPERARAAIFQRQHKNDGVDAVYTPADGIRRKDGMAAAFARYTRRVPRPLQPTRPLTLAEALLTQLFVTEDATLFCDIFFNTNTDERNVLFYVIHPQDGLRRVRYIGNGVFNFSLAHGKSEDESVNCAFDQMVVATLPATPVQVVTVDLFCERLLAGLISDSSLAVVFNVLMNVVSPTLFILDHSLRRVIDVLKRYLNAREAIVR